MSLRLARPLMLAAVAVLPFALTACSSAKPKAATKGHSATTTTAPSTTSTAPATTGGSGATTLPPASTAPGPPASFKIPVPSAVTIPPPADVPGGLFASVMGIGKKTSNPFTVPSGTKEWDVTSTFSCPADKTTSVVISVRNAVTGDTVAADKPTRTPTASSGHATGRYHDSGRFVLRVTGSCYWIVNAAYPPKPTT